MHIIKRLKLKNCGTYKDCDFHFDKGITTIYGLNRARPNSKNGNGAGKSFLFSQVQDILVKSDKSNKLGSRQLDLITSNKDKVRVKYNRNRLRLVRNGIEEDKSIKGNQKELSKIVNPYIPLYVDAVSGHPLIVGNSTVRKHYLSSFFNLDEIDKEKKILQGKKKGLKSKLAILPSLIEEKNRITLVDIKELKLRLKSINTKLDKYRKLQDRFTEYQKHQIFLNSVKTCLPLVKGIDNSEFKSEIKITESKISRLETRLKDYRDFIEFREELKKYNKKISSIPEKLRKHINSELKSKAFKYEEFKYKYDLIKIKNIEKPKEISKVEKVDLILIEKLEHQLEHNKKFGGGFCPTCHQKVKSVDVSKLRKELKKLREKYNSYLEYLEFKKKRDDYFVLKEENNRLKSKKDSLKSLVDKYKKYHKLYSIVKDLRKPVKRGTDTDVSNVKAKLKDLKLKLNALTILEPNIDLLNKKIDKCEDYGDRINQLMTSKSRLQAKLEIAKFNNSRYSELEDRIESLAKYRKELKKVELILLAYEDKAMKKMAIEVISEKLTEKINSYRSFFPENYRFEVSWKSNLDILVHREYKNTVVTTDVKKLSGGEYKLFVLILIMSLLNFVPSKDRFNLLILDEPSANMHEETRQIFIQILDVMLKIIPCIVIITPRSEERYKGREYTVIKEKGKSRIVEGHPSEVQ